LRAVIRPSLALATVGVVIATLVGGLVLWQVAGLSFYVAFLFAVLIAPTDVVTILEVFRRVRVPHRLTILLNTEAAFNDATAIVMFTIILSSATLHQAGVLEIATNFGFTLLGGLLVGLGVAFLAEILSSLIEDRVAECILTVSVVYGSFALATGIGASGIIAVAVTGLYFGNFTMRAAMESATRNTIKTFWEVVAFLANSVAFLFLGFQTDILTLSQSIVLILIAFLAVTVARAATVYPILALFNRRGGQKTSRTWINIAWVGGVRGALSIVLAATITTSAVISAGDIRTIQTMALGVAFLSITLQVPLLSHYARTRFRRQQTEDGVEINERLSSVCTAIDDIRQLRTEGKISEQEFADKLEQYKDELDETIHESSALKETRRIIRERAELLYSSVKSKPKKKSKDHKKTAKKAPLESEEKVEQREQDSH
jgi:CPA1 family monovalent cation:H+ antiporter